MFESIDSIIDGQYKKRQELIKKLIGDTVVDALLFMPSYSVYKEYVEVPSKKYLNRTIVIKFKPLCIETRPPRTKMPEKIVGLSGGEVPFTLLFFQARAGFFKYYMKIGVEVAVCGKLSENSYGELQFVHPETMEQISKLHSMAGIYNVYPLTAAVTIYIVRSVIKNALSKMKNFEIDEWIPQEILALHGWPSFKESIEMVHNPETEDDVTLRRPYIQRLCFDEFLAEHISKRLGEEFSNSNGFIIDTSKTVLLDKFVENLPFKLTEEQGRVLSEILCDLSSGKSMRRLLQGDVGSGKTIVALLASLVLIENGYQVALLAPTELLARQHYETFTKMLDVLDIHVDILTSFEKGKKRTCILQGLLEGRTNIIVGTHAIISDTVEFNKLGLVIVDEQHRFGVNQRLMLINKAVNPHILSMTATPIPRTLLLSMHGDINVSTINSKPFGRKDIITRALPLHRINELIDSIWNIINKKEKVYWICPLIEESTKLDYTCVINRFNFLRQYFGDRVIMMHGKMKSTERNKIFDKFKGDECDILVSTTIIEVGVDIPNASVIIIENAEKFGLSQLHQLRGRVGRSDLQSYCILLYDEKKTGRLQMERINTIRESNDGFYIADKDLSLRGSGDVLGTRQSGFKEYKILKTSDPMYEEVVFKLMREARDAAKTIDVCQAELLLKIFASENIKDIKRSF